MISKNKNKKSRIGTVVSDKSNKTIVVDVVRTMSHPIYKKVLKRTKKYQVHDPENTATIGDIVRIEETRPISKLKRWILVDIITDRDVAGIAATEIDVNLITEIEQSVKNSGEDKIDVKTQASIDGNLDGKIEHEDGDNK
ncbi:MAG: small subunit ribosomal protein S17 [Chloroflexi bacterium]|jgi:small subunit ribosomal protein S17|nr:MAG: small subunit ribosomal protein S17 [Chloroflexota bacterium]